MAILQALFENGMICLIAAAILIIECVVLMRCAPSLSARQVFMNAVSGLGLLLALYFALTDAGFIATATGLTLGLIGHIGDLHARLVQRQA